MKYEPRYGPIDLSHPVDQHRATVMKYNKKIGKRLMKKRPRPEGYRDPDYELSDSDEDEVFAKLDPEDAAAVRELQAARQCARDEIARLTKQPRAWANPCLIR